jgi:Na+/H+-dicarboxylate symporter
MAFFRSLEQIHPKSLLHLADRLQVLIRAKLWLQILIAMVLGIGTGIVLGPSVGLLPADTAEIIGEWIALPGYFFLGIIQMIIVPLVFSSVVRGIAANENAEQLQKTGLRLLIYFLFTTTVAVFIQTAEKELGVRSSIARFIIPIGATINMDASALYQGLATIFIAQLYGMELTIAAQLALILTAVGASIGTPATPGVGIVILSSVLVSVGIPIEGLTLLIGLDRILELFRSSLNVTGDLVAATVMDRTLERKATIAAAQTREG